MFLQNFSIVWSVLAKRWKNGRSNAVEEIVSAYLALGEVNVQEPKRKWAKEEQKHISFIFIISDIFCVVNQQKSFSITFPMVVAYILVYAASVSLLLHS